MFPLFFPHRWTKNDWQETCGAEYSADRDNDFISLFAHYQLFTCTVIFSLWTHFLTFCRQQCGGNQKSPSYQSVVHDKQLSSFMSRLFFGLSQDAPLCHKTSCVSSIIWTAVSLCPQQRSRQMFDFLFSVQKCDDKQRNSKSLFKQEIQIFGISDIVMIVVCQDLVWEDPISFKSAHTCGG